MGAPKLDAVRVRWESIYEGIWAKLAVMIQELPPQHLFLGLLIHSADSDSCWLLFP